MKASSQCVLIRYLDCARHFRHGHGYRGRQDGRHGRTAAPGPPARPPLRGPQAGGERRRSCGAGRPAPQRRRARVASRGIDPGRLRDRQPALLRAVDRASPRRPRGRRHARPACAGRVVPAGLARCRPRGDGRRGRLARAVAPGGLPERPARGPRPRRAAGGRPDARVPEPRAIDRRGRRPRAAAAAWRAGSPTRSTRLSNASRTTSRRSPNCWAVRRWPAFRTCDRPCVPRSAIRYTTSWTTSRGSSTRSGSPRVESATQRVVAGGDSRVH